MKSTDVLLYYFPIREAFVKIGTLQRKFGNRLWFLELMLIAALTAAVVAGCGGSSGDSSSGSTSTAEGKEVSSFITKAELIKRGDAICHHADQVQKKLLAEYMRKHHGPGTSRVEQEKFVEFAGLPPVKAEIEELAALGAPKGNEAQVGKIVSGLEKALKATEANAARILGEGVNPFDAPGRLAASYGFEECASAL
jgi:hypothetical protein